MTQRMAFALIVLVASAAHVEVASLVVESTAHVSTEMMHM